MTARATLRDLPHWRRLADGRVVPADAVLCPECGSVLDVVEYVEVFYPETGARRVVARLAQCYGCEFTHEF